MSSAAGMYHDPVNTARETRARYRYQDECVALRCIHNLVSPGIASVVVEWCSDYLTVAADGTVELVSIKHREADQPAWTPSAVRPVLVDLHRYWRAMEERCSCVFASSVGVSADVTRLRPGVLAGWLGVHEAEAARFWAALALPTADTVLPRRKEITAVAVRDLAAVLEHLDRDPAYAEACYDSLVRCIAQASIDEPSTPAQRIARLTGSIRSVLDRAGPDPAAQTLRLDQLRGLVLKTHDVCAAEQPTPVVVCRSTTPAVQRVEPERWHRGTRVRLSAGVFLVHEPVATEMATDGGQVCQRAKARQLEPIGRDVWLTEVRLLSDAPGGQARLAALEREAGLLGDLSGVDGAPRLVALDTTIARSTLVIGLPDARPLPDALGPARTAYPSFVLDALLRGLPPLFGVLAALHRRKLAHRALAPEALLFTVAGKIVPRDLGLAVLAPVPGEGPPGYRAPEQDRPLLVPPGPHTDVYQLAAVLYHVASGQPPGPTPVPLSLLRPDLNPRLGSALGRALRADHRQRCTLQELHRELNAILRHGGTAAGLR